MNGLLEFVLGLNESELRAALVRTNKEVEDTNTKANATINNLQKKVKLSRRQVVSLVQQGTNAIISMLEAAGVSVSSQFRILLTAGFSAINILMPLLTAESVTPGMQFMAAIGLINLGLAAIAIAQAQREESEAARRTNQAMQALSNVSSMVGMMNW